MPKLKVSLFGETRKIKRLHIEDTLLQKINLTCSKHNLNVVEALLDLNFYELLKEPFINSIFDFEHTQVGGLMNTPKSQVEIWFNSKKIKKLKLIEVFKQDTLFDLYHTTTINVSFDELEEGIYIIDYEIGLFGSYEKQIEKFSIDLMNFGLLKFKRNAENIELLSEIFYSGELLRSYKEDLLITRTECLIIHKNLGFLLRAT
jgi:hypothetical protein